MQETLRDFALTLEASVTRLTEISEEESLRAKAPGKWTRKEILGHLIDSAANNHQRFVRAMQTDEYFGPRYDQDAWVEVQQYAEEPWRQIVELWTAYNRHLLHVMSRIPEEAHDRPCIIGELPPVSLGYLMTDYVRHLRHHLADIVEEI